MNVSSNVTSVHRRVPSAGIDWHPRRQVSEQQLGHTLHMMLSSIYRDIFTES